MIYVYNLLLNLDSQLKQADGSLPGLSVAVRPGCSFFTSHSQPVILLTRLLTGYMNLPTSAETTIAKLHHNLRHVSWTKLLANCLFNYSAFQL